MSYSVLQTTFKRKKKVAKETASSAIIGKRETLVLQRILFTERVGVVVMDFIVIDCEGDVAGWSRPNPK